MALKRSPGRPRYPDWLTPAEWRIVHAVRHGMTNRMIAARLGVSRNAVRYHLRNVFGKLALRGRYQLQHWSGVPLASGLHEKEHTMDGPIALGPIGQISREVSDVAQAEAWYRDVLGLRHLYTFGHLAFFDCGGTRLFLTHHDDGNTAGNSILYFMVPDIATAHRQLSDRGVTFLGAPHLIHRHGDGTEEWMAFFSDPDGHPLALMSQVPPQR